MTRIAVPTTIVWFALVSFPSHGFTWPWGPKNYEECVAADMKGRDRSQMDLVEKSCHKKFPKLPSFVDKTHYGSLRCFYENGRKYFDVAINADRVTTDFGSLEVLIRDESHVRSGNSKLQLSPKLSTGAELVINFEEGIGFLGETSGMTSWQLFCRQQG